MLPECHAPPENPFDGESFDGNPVIDRNMAKPFTRMSGSPPLAVGLRTSLLTIVDDPDSGYVPSMPRVTRITRQQKDSFRLSVFVDDKFSFGCSEEMCLSLGLHEGDDIDPERIGRIKESLHGDVIRQKALWYLSRRNHSRLEMKRYLLKRKYDQDQIEATLSWLDSKGYLDDAKFADEWAKMRVNRGSRGRQGLMNELLSKGIDRHTATEIVDRNLPDENESEAAFQLLLQKKNRFQRIERLELKGKIYNFLNYRGFSHDAIAAAYRRFAAEKSGIENAE